MAGEPPPVRLPGWVKAAQRELDELRHHPEPYGVEAQFFKNEELIIGRRFDARLDPTRPPRELAIAWALEWRKGIEEGH